MFRGKPELSAATRDEVFGKDMIMDLFRAEIRGIKNLDKDI